MVLYLQALKLDLVAQLVEHLPFKERVLGSSPSQVTILAHVAELVDALGWGPSGKYPLEVRVLSCALYILKKKVFIIGSGFSSLSAACYLAKYGFDVSVFEKNDSFGGRARQFKTNGYTFDMGPSWYWMPDVFERFFNDFNKKSVDLY